MTHATELKLLEEEEALLSERIRHIRREKLELDRNKLKSVRNTQSNFIGMRDRNFKSSDM